MRVKLLPRVSVVALTKVILMLVGFWAQTSRAMNLEEFLAAVQKRNGMIQSYDASQSAAQDRYQQGDLALSPVLTLKSSFVDDKALQMNVPTFIITHQKVREYSLGLGKKFSTGTSAQVSASTTELFFDALSPLPVSDQRAIGGLGFSLSQSLWKDGFGRGTRLRWQREDASRTLEVKTYDLQAKQVLIEAEGAFWDLVYLEQELQLRNSSLERARKIESWIRSRVANGIGDKADHLNAQGLVAAREFQLLNTQDELTAARKKIVDLLEVGSSKTKGRDPSGAQEFSEVKLEAPLHIARPLLGMVSNHQTNGRILRLDTYLSSLEATAKQTAAIEVEDSMRPDLTVEAGYRLNNYQTDAATASAHFTDSDKPTTALAIKLTWLLDGDTKDATRRAAQADALAARLKRDRKFLESESSWNEILRRHQEMTGKIKAAEKIGKIQRDKANAERDRLARGRTVTSQVVTAEQDAAEAELTLTKLRAEQRKLEAQARLFVKVDL